MRKSRRSQQLTKSDLKYLEKLAEQIGIGNSTIDQMQFNLIRQAREAFDRQLIDALVVKLQEHGIDARPENFHLWIGRIKRITLDKENDWYAYCLLPDAASENPEPEILLKTCEKLNIKWDNDNIKVTIGADDDTEPRTCSHHQEGVKRVEETNESHSEDGI